MPYVYDGKINQDRGIYFEEIGSGEPVVLINGMSRSSRHWLGFEKELAKSCHVIMIDNRGAGRSRNLKPRIGDTVQIMAADVWQVCDALRLDRVHFVGLSLGGMIGLAASLANQNRTSSLTMINSSIGGNLFPRLSVKAVGALVTDMARSRDTLKTVATYLIGGVSDERRDWIVERWQEIEEEEPVTVGLLQAQLWAAARFRVRKLLHNLKVPVLIYCARDDRFVPIINSSLLHAQIPRSEYKVVDHGGHEATAAFPQETARDIAEFIERCALKNQSPSVTKRQRPASKKSNR